jgi:nicotinate phosphoribosyltransferase
MIQLFLALGKTELDAFRAFSEIYPDNCILLVDTINTLESGVPNAIRVFEELKKKGHKPVGIRLDSGDLAHLSIMSAKMMNQAGFTSEKIVLSNQLDEIVITQIIKQIREEAPAYEIDPESIVERLAYGVGTSLITSGGDPALDGVYKLTAIKEKGKWIPTIKISETPKKSINPGLKKVWRIYDKRNRATADLLSCVDEEPSDMEVITLQHPIEAGTNRKIRREEISGIEPLLVDVVLDGKQVYETPDIESIRKTRISDLEKLDPGVKRLVNPHICHVSLTEKLWNLKQDVIREQKSS